MGEREIIMNKVENQIERLLGMKKEFDRAIDEAITALKDIEERSKTQEWLDYAEEYGYEEGDLIFSACDRLDEMECYYNRAYELSYLDDIAYSPLEEIL